MINVTDTIKEAYSKSTTQYDKIVLDDVEYAINNVELDDDCYEEYDDNRCEYCFCFQKQFLILFLFHLSPRLLFSQSYRNGRYMIHDARMGQS